MADGFSRRSLPAMPLSSTFAVFRRLFLEKEPETRVFERSGASISRRGVVKTPLRPQKPRAFESIAKKPGVDDEHFAIAERISW
jgi:hypothetical protein